MAARNKYSAALSAHICDMLRIGATRTASYTSAGISQATFLRYIARHADFAAAVELAEAEAEIMYTAALSKAANGVKTGFEETTKKTIFKPRVVKVTSPDGTVTETTDYASMIETSTTVRTGEESEWRAAESWLKRRRPKDWKENVDVTSDGKHVDVVVISGVSMSDL